jgi:hypothetical protein
MFCVCNSQAIPSGTNNNLIKRVEKNETRFSYDTILPEALPSQDNYLNVDKH